MTLRHILIAAPLLGTMSAPATAQDCAPIRFAPGAVSGQIRGVAPPDDVLCYSVGTGAGQTMTVAVTGRNMFVSVPGVADAQDAIRFTTAAGTYQVRVGQLMRSVTDEPFVLDVEIR